MKEKLYDTLIEKFEKDKDLIKENIIKFIPNCYIEVNNEYGIMKLEISYRRKVKNNENINKQTI